MSKVIKGVEIFSVGNWNGDNYTQKDLEEMVKAFNDNPSIKPYLKLGHDSKQKLLQSDGYPAAGWIDRVYIKGSKLCADFVDIPSKIYDLIVNKAYKKVSSEIFWNIKVGDKTYSRMLAAVALLGADTPGVMNLNDILAMYKTLENNYEKIGSGDAMDLKEFSTNGKEDVMSKTEKEIELELKLQAAKEEAEKLEVEKKEFASKQAEAQKEIDSLKQFKAEAEAEKIKLQEENEKIRIEKFTADLVNEKLCTPAMKEFVSELIGPDKKEYTAKKLSKEDAVKEMLKLFKSAKDVNFEENSSKDVEKKDFKKEDEQEKAVKEYMEKNKCSYKEAAKAIINKQKEK